MSASNVGNDGSAITLKQIVERLALFPENSITFYAPQGGGAVKKSYPQLQADVMAAAERLRARGVQAGMRVGLLATNSYEWIVYNLALIHLQCICVCFPEEFGSESSDELVEKYDLSLLLMLKRDTWPKLSAGEWGAYMDAEDSPQTGIRSGAAHQANDESIFSLVFSSGTTGKMKCMVTNDLGIEDAIETFLRLFEIKSSDSILVFLHLSGIQQHFMLYGALLHGFDLQLIKPPQLFVALKDLKPTLCVGPPLLYETIHNQFKNALRNLGTFRRFTFHSLNFLADHVPLAFISDSFREVCYKRLYGSLGGRTRLMWTGMAPIKRSTLEFFAQARLPLYEAYGLSECGVIASNTPGRNKIGSVGRPVSDGSVRLMDDGEIVVHRDNLPTMGYLGSDREGEKSTYLQPNTVATGDVGRFDEEGYLYLVGRKKDIIITRQGYKLHPETLEARINRCPRVERSVVLGNDMAYLVAVISVQGPLSPDVKSEVEAFIDQLNATLPQSGRIIKYHLTDEQFTLQNGLMTRNLKLDRRALFNRFEKEF